MKGYELQVMIYQCKPGPEQGIIFGFYGNDFMNSFTRQKQPI